jgi:DNA-binding NarL/FixJ family response regulator
MEITKVLIVDDQDFFSEMLCRTLAAEPGLEVVGVARDGEMALQLARERAPDVVLMDIELPGELDGIEAGLLIKGERPQTGIVILSAHKDQEYIASLPLDRSSGWSYLLKQSVPDLATVVRAIQGSRRGLVVLDPEVVASLRPRQGSLPARLTPAQRNVLELLAQGYSNAAIGQRLTLAEKSVEAYIHTIYQQLELVSLQDINARVRATLIYLQDSQTQ